MKWIRANIKQGSQLALVAFALQILISFGHFHGVHAPGDHPLLHPAPLAAAGSSNAVVSPIADVSSAKPIPASRHDPDRQPDDPCAICAVMAMAHALVVAAQPVLRLPQAIELFCLTIGAGFIQSNPARVAFQPRAPPIY
jgi:hypothetical protein